MNFSKSGGTISSGAFTVRNIEGVIDPKDKTEIDIDCYINETDVQEDYLIVFISESCPRDRNGKQIKLKATGCVPSLKWDDYDFMFHEHFIVNTLQDFIKPKEVSKTELVID